MLYFPGEKEKALNYASKILNDKVNCCKKYKLERLNNRAEASYVCMKCGDCEFLFSCS